MQKKIVDDRYKEALEHEKALFDFDENINDLELVEERYPIVNDYKEQ